MKNNTIIIIVIAVIILGGALVYFLGFAGEKVAEKTAEKAIESATNGAADVDIDDNTVTINTNAGSITVGETSTLPDGFPSDIHVIDGEITSALTMTENEAYSVSIETSKTVAQVKAEYETELANDGWTINLTMDTGEVVTIGAEKGNRTVTVSAMVDEGKTTVSIGTSTIEQ